MSTDSKQETVLLHLPSEILINILSRLPVRSILCCKCVCKEFLQIISTHEFAKSHLSESNPPGLVIYQHQEERLFKLLEYEDTLKLQSQDLRDLEVMKFEPNFSFMGDCPESTINCLGSVAGFLCLGRFSDLRSFYICNPITREVIHIPMPDKVPYFDRCGFGLSRLSGQYKVVVTYSIANSEPLVNECFVYTLGTTGSWRSVAHDALLMEETHYTSLFMNGNLHWVVIDNDSVPLISCFDLESEQFKYFPPPPDWHGDIDGASLIDLDNCLCLCDSDWESNCIVFWVMTEYGIEKSWTRKFQISKKFLEDGLFGWYNAIYPVKAFADGGILFYVTSELLFHYCDKTKSTRSVEVFEDDSRRGFIEMLIHTFSFISLKRFGVENVISF